MKTPTAHSSLSNGAYPLKVFIRSGIADLSEYSAVGDFVIGRGANCSLRIKDDVVSRSHCRVIWNNNQWWIEDLHSANGLFVQGERVKQYLLQERTIVRLGASGPVLELMVEIPPSSAKDDSNLDHYISHYFTATSDSAGDHTMMVRRAFAEVQQKQKRRYFGIISLIVVLLLLSTTYAIYRHMAFNKQRHLATDIFYQMKVLEIELAQVIKTTEQSRSIETSLKIEKFKQRQKEMEKSYDQFTDTLKVYGKNISDEERLILKMARAFGECEITMPEGFTQEVLDYIQKWKSTGRLQRALQRAQRKGYVQQIARTLADHGLPNQFFYLALQESNFNVNAVGPPTRFGIAKGMWQFIPSTAIKYGLRPGPMVDKSKPDSQDERHDFGLSTLAAARYLRDIYATDAQASGLLVMAAYNWGEHRIVPLLNTLPENPRDRNFWELFTKYRNKIPEQTYDYVFSIFSAAVIGENPRLFGFDFDNPLGESVKA